ncbi:MAG: hypothetical protein ABIJ43_02035 [Candidatus Beckwithbacteria bacterium]|nr:hypothetical protein [Patescibacteria group bacterium]
MIEQRHNHFKGVFKRLVRVIYISLLVLGVVVSVGLTLELKPYSVAFYSYKVICDNGNQFDPTSKPIDKYDENGYKLKDLIKQDKLINFDEKQIISECEYKTVWYAWAGKINIPKNYELKVEKIIDERTVINQIKVGLVVFIFYNLILEVVRRIVLYVILGRKFI